MSYFKFYLRKNYTNKQGKHNILIRFYESRENRIQINTGNSISARYWSETKNRIKKSAEIETELEIFEFHESLANKIISYYKENNIKLTKEKFKKHFINRKVDFESKPKRIIEFYNELDLYIERKKNMVSTDVIKDYNSLKKHLTGSDTHREETTTFGAITYDFYENWINFLSSELIQKNGEIGLKNNTIGKLVKNLKAFLNDCMRRKLIDKIDLSQFKVLQEEVDHIYLNYNEIDNISKIDCKNDKELETTKDFFILGCYTGLRFSDIIRLKPEYIENNFIHINQKKTGKKVVIPLRPPALKILEKYNYYSPTITSLIFNKRIKELGQKAKLNSKTILEHKKGNTKIQSEYLKYELITSHTCRRSFCTNAYLEGIDTYLIMQISGHKTEKAFKRYLKLSSFEAALKMKEAWKI